MVSIVDAFTDPNLLGTSFGGDSREAWRAILSGAFALPMEQDRLALFKQLAGGRQPPTQRVRELWSIAGRRSDKSHTAAGVAIHIGTIDAEQEGILDNLTAGERGVILCLACNRDQAKVVLAYVKGMIAESPVLSTMLASDNKDGVTLTNGVSIEVATNSYRVVRGRTLLAAVLDECAFFHSSESSSPDSEVYRALVPSLATTGGMLIGISSPYARRGLVFDKWRKHYGKPGGAVLVTQASSAQMNPTIPQSVIDEAYADDPDAAKAEWGGQFRSDVEAFISRDVVDRCTRSGPLEIPRQPEHQYFGFTDPAGGGADEFVSGVAHTEGQTTVIDCIRAQRGKPADIVADHATLLKQYGLSSVTGDRYAGSWVGDEYARNDVAYNVSEKPKSGLYLDMLPALNSERVELPPDDKLANQIASLERKNSRGGRPSIDHPPNASDDRANVIAGLCSLGGGPSSVLRLWEKLVIDEDETEA